MPRSPRLAQVEPLGMVGDWLVNLRTTNTRRPPKSFPFVVRSAEARRFSDSIEINSFYIEKAFSTERALTV